ncbi:RNA polymerase sigma factor [Candidatus Gracilibacteria bacterium]|nr:RNA polymerase sigma factor [Candidatus Gracilibacteria bacterium]
MNEINLKRERIETLVREVKEGSHDAFSELYDIFIDSIYRYVFYRVKNDDAEDITENVFLKVWENIQSYKEKKDTYFSSWIFRIAHNVVVDYYRASKDKMVGEIDVSIPDMNREHNPLRKIEKHLDNQVLRSALNRLKKGYQDILIYKFINDFSNAEIAEVLGQSEGSIRILQFRALKALKQEFEQMGIKYEIGVTNAILIRLKG